MLHNLIFALVILAVPSTRGKHGKISIFSARTEKIEQVEPVVKTNAEWRKMLTLEQYRSTRLKETEIPFSNKCELPPKGEKGVYQCVGCGTDLFRVETKFESGTGWPSFWKPVSDLNIKTKPDNSLGIHRTEINCARCNAHLGHLFDDGPPPTGKRYCLNALALKLVRLPQKVAHFETATFGAGCFWGTEATFRQLKGVIKTTVGFMGGTLKNPTYEEVSTRKTGHAEVVQLEYDPNQASYQQLLNIFWSMHDPTTPDRQGPDVGTQYRSVIFYYTPEQEKIAQLSKQKLDKSRKFKNPIVTKIVPAQEFYPAEEYHQQYYEKRGIKPACQLPVK
ncbi:MAG: bifunctional methionine sulfoxide reductase B/A protein [Candidatus Omnitrophica bacterium]|nr:bifunctional methionine sulfoxide reductase B/A protein [Candidatus Omnitrophota bacterium]